MQEHFGSLSLQKNGPADVKTMRALEDAVLSRARQIREADSMF